MTVTVARITDRVYRVNDVINLVVAPRVRWRRVRGKKNLVVDLYTYLQLTELVSNAIPFEKLIVGIEIS